jgi:hypothetical protein
MIQCILGLLKDFVYIPRDVVVSEHDQCIEIVLLHYLLLEFTDAVSELLYPSSALLAAQHYRLIYQFQSLVPAPCTQWVETFALKWWHMAEFMKDCFAAPALRRPAYLSGGVA